MEDDDEAPPKRSFLAWKYVNIGHFITYPGLLKLMQLTFGFFCMEYVAPFYEAIKGFLHFCVSFGFIGTLFWTLVYLFRVKDRFNWSMWLIVEMIINGMSYILYFGFIIIYTLEYQKHYKDKSTKEWSVVLLTFALFNSIAYAMSTINCYFVHRARVSAARLKERFEARTVSRIESTLEPDEYDIDDEFLY